MFYKKPALVLSFLLLVGACASMPSPEGKPMADLTFSHLSPVSLVTMARFKILYHYPYSALSGQAASRFLPLRGPSNFRVTVISRHAL